MAPSGALFSAKTDQCDENGANSAAISSQNRPNVKNLCAEQTIFCGRLYTHIAESVDKSGKVRFYQGFSVDKPVEIVDEAATDAGFIQGLRAVYAALGRRIPRKFYKL